MAGEEDGVGAELQPYLALQLVASGDGRALGLESLMALTPRCMRWQEVAGEPTVWLLDLSPCLSYWRERSRQRELAPLTLIRELLDQVCAPLGSWRGVLASHPWPALLLLGQMGERGLTGLLQGMFAERLLRELSWSRWLAAAAEVAGHRQALGGRSAKLWSHDAAQLRRAVARLGLPGPWALREATGASLKRRFGSLAAELWRWAYGEGGQVSPEPEWVASSFPWRGEQLPRLPRVVRHLDHPMLTWEQLIPWLREDCDRLCRLDTWSDAERVVALNWRLILADGASQLIPLMFRHPHALHGEMGHHRTTLLQAQYGFEARSRALTLEQPTGIQRESPGPKAVVYEPQARVQAVIGWELLVSERLVSRAHERPLLSTVSVAAEPALVPLENQLALPLRAYELRAERTPETSYAQVLAEGKGQSPREDLVTLGPSLLAAAGLRPLYCYDEPRAFAAGEGDMGIFLERTLDDWWRSGVMGEPRDYYRRQDGVGRWWWVYRRGVGPWFVQGGFG